MKFKKEEYYTNSKAGIIVIVTEIVGPSVYFKVVEDTNATLYMDRAGQAGSFHGYNQEEVWTKAKGYGTVLWKVMNS